MKHILAAATAVLLLAGNAASAPTAPPARWSEFDAQQRLETGRFAARWGIAHATCLGVGKGAGPAYDRTFTRFECKTFNATFDNERHLDLRVTGETTFRVTWLNGRPC